MSGSSYQTTVSLASASSGNLNSYFKLKAPDPGTISLTKTTEDGKNLSGWQFGIYSNSACTTLVSGPHSTNTSGKISVTELTPGTYYVKELGHTVHEVTIDGKTRIVASDTTKTKSSYRSLPLVKPFEEILLKMKREQEENKRLCGRCYCQDYLDYIYVNQIGEIVNLLIVKEEETGYTKWQDFFNIIAPALTKILIHNAVFFNGDLLFYFFAFRCPRALNTQSRSVIKA